jgi:DNA-binding MurR/RpiR family transcriptional regulator
MLGRAVVDRIKHGFDAMPDQMRSAATFVIENPKEVALLSMRDLARQAGVPAATMTRLAQRLGYAGFEELRAVFADDLRKEPLSFSSRTEGMLTRRQEVGERRLACDVVSAIAEAVVELTTSKALERLAAAADRICSAKRVFCCGARSSFPVAFLFGYLQSYLWDRACILDGAGGTGTDPLLRAGPGDVLLAVSFDPYARTTVEDVRRAASAGVGIIAITDKELGGIGCHADISILVSNGSPSFFDTMTPAFAAAEVLAAMVAGRLGPDIAKRVREREALIAEAGVWESEASPNPRRPASKPSGNRRGRPHV